MSEFLEILSAFFFLFSIYALGATSGLLSEKAGIVNISIEGTMIIGAAWFGIVSSLLQTHVPQILNLIISLLIAVLISALYIQLLSIFTIKFLADHTIAGTGLNLLAPALAVLFSGVILNNASEIPASNFSKFNIILDNGGTFSLISILAVIITIVILLLIWFFINQTKYGLRLKAAGENPYALETAGISVNKTKYISLTIAGAISGLAGAFFIINRAFYFTVNGNGFISLGILIFGQWSILGITIGSLLIGMLVAIFQNWVVVFGGDSSLGFLMNIIPFIIPILGLMIFKSATGPAAVGKPFKKDMR